MSNFMRKYAKKFWKSFSYYILGLYHRIDRHHIFLMSAGVAFTMFVCIIPLLLIVFFVLSNIVARPEIINEINAMIDRFIPYPEYAEMVKNEIVLKLVTLTNFNRIVGLIGVFGVIFTGSSLFSSIRTVLNKIFHPYYIEKFLLEKLYDFVLIAIVLILFWGTIFILPVVNTVLNLANSVAWLEKIGAGALKPLLVQSVSVFVTFSMFFIVFWLIPLSRTKIRIVLVSSITATVFWRIAEFLFGFYLSHVVTLQYLYGVYAFLVIVAFWIYYAAFSMFVAAEIGQLYFERWQTEKEKHKSIFFNDDLEPK